MKTKETLSGIITEKQYSHSSEIRFRVGTIEWFLSYVAHKVWSMCDMYISINRPYMYFEEDKFESTFLKILKKRREKKNES